MYECDKGYAHETGRPLGIGLKEHTSAKKSFPPFQISSGKHCKDWAYKMINIIEKKSGLLKNDTENILTIEQTEQKENTGDKPASIVQTTAVSHEAMKQTGL